MGRSKGGYEEPPGDDLVFRCSAVALGGGAVAAAGAAFGCANDVLIIFAPELSYLLLAPATLIALLGAVGLCAARREESKVFRAQLAVFLTLLACSLAAAGAFGYQFSATAAAWVDMGCEGHNATGLWLLGLLLGVLAGLVCVPILGAALALFCGARLSDEDYYQTVGDDDADDNELRSLTGESSTSGSPTRYIDGEHDPFGQWPHGERGRWAQE